MDIREVPDVQHGTLRLLAKPFDVTFRGGHWFGPGSENLEAGVHGRRVLGNYEPDALILPWPRRVMIRKMTGAHVEIRKAIVGEGRDDVTQEEADADAAAAWPESERQAMIPTVTPFAIVALEGANIVGELFAEIE